MTTAFTRSLDSNDKSGFGGVEARARNVVGDAGKACESSQGIAPAIPGVCAACLAASATDANPWAVSPSAFVGTLSDAELEELVAEGRREQEARRARKVAAFLASVRAGAEALGLDSATVAAAMAAAGDARPRFVHSGIPRRRRSVQTLPPDAPPGGRRR